MEVYEIENSSNILTRYDIYKFLIKERPFYRGAHDYYSLERYLSTIYRCECTDCGVHDFSGKCKVEKYFFGKYGLLFNSNMV